MELDGLKKKIKDDNISLYKLSRQSGVAYATLHDIVNGKTQNPTLNTVLKISKGLGENIENII